MNADQLIAELAKVAPADAREWADLRSAEIKKLTTGDCIRVYSEYDKLARLAPAATDDV